MDYLQWIADTINAALKHGLSLTTLIVAVTALLRVRKVKRRIKKLIPLLGDDESEVKEYVANQARIESKLDALMSAGGVSWDVGLQIGKTAPSSTSGQQKKSLLQQAAYALVTITRYFTRSMVIYPSQQRRMKMKRKLLSRKFILALATGILVILNDGLGMGLSTETIMYVVGIVALWITGEAAIDVSGKEKKTTEIETSYHGE